jgi:hypothetical protein
MNAFTAQIPNVNTAIFRCWFTLKVSHPTQSQGVGVESWGNNLLLEEFLKLSES